MEIKKELIDELLKNYQKPEDVIGENGLLKQLTKALLERAMDAELTHHLGYEKRDPAGYQQRELAERHHPQDAEGGVRRVGDRNTTGPQRQFRAADGEEAPNAVGWFRRQDSVDVCARDDHPRDPGTSGRDVRGRGQSGVDLGSHRRGHGRGAGVAEPALGASVWDRLSGRPVCEDAPRRASGEPRGVRGDRHRIGWTKGRPGAMDEQPRRRQVLAGSADGDQEPRRQGRS